MRREAHHAWLAEGLALGLALALVALACLALWQAPRAADFPAASPPPAEGFYLLEQPSDGDAFRWTAESTRMTLPNPGGRPILTLRLSSGAGRAVEARLGGAVAATLAIGPAPRRYQLLLPPAPAERLVLTLSAPPFRPPGETRALGMRLFAVGLGGGGAPPAHVPLAALALTLALYTALRTVAGPWRAGPFAALPALALLAWHAPRWPMVTLAPRAALLSVAALLAALGWYLVLAARARWLASPPSRAPLPLVVPAALLYCLPLVWNWLYLYPRLDSDLGIYLEAARALVAGGSPYDTLGIGTIVIGESFVYPPAILPLFVALAALGDSAARMLWLVASAALYLLALLSLYAALPRPQPRGALWAILGLGLAYAPFAETLAIGQINSLVLLGLALFIHGHAERRLAWAGDLAIAVAIIVKLTPGLLLLWPLLRGDWARLARVAFAAIALCMPALLLYGPGPWAEFVGLLPQLFAGVPRNPFNQAITGVLTSLTVPGSPAEAAAAWVGRAASLLLLASFAAACWLRRRDNGGMTLAYGVAVVTTASSLIWYHHLTFLSIPLAWLALAAPGGPRGRAVALAALALVQLSSPLVGMLGPPAWAAAAGYLIVALALGARVLAPPRAT